MDRSALVGLLSGLAVVVLTLITVALVNLPAAEGADTARHGGCREVQVAQDAGYALSRSVSRQVCGLLR